MLGDLLFGLILNVQVNNFSVILTCLPGLNQYLAADKVSCLSTQHCDCVSSEGSPANSQLYQLSSAVNSLYYHVINQVISYYSTQLQVQGQLYIDRRPKALGQYSLQRT